MWSSAADGAGAGRFDAGLRGQLHVGLETGRDHHQIAGHVRQLSGSMAPALTPQRNSTPCLSSCLRTAAVKCGSSRQQNVLERSSTGHAQSRCGAARRRASTRYTRSDPHRGRGRFLADEAAHPLGVFDGMQREDVGLAGRPAMPAVSQRAPVAITGVVMPPRRRIEAPPPAR